MSTEKLTYSRVWTDAEAFPRLGFTKNWENPEDYPTIETDEAKVREDMQSLHDETKDYINETLIPAILAEDATEEARIAAENSRAENELSRVQAEQTRVSHENARIQAEAAREAAEKQRQSAISGQVASTTQSASSAAQSATAAAASKVEAAKLVAQAQQAVENAATVEIGTVAEGDTMSVTNVGTKRAAKLNFVLRRGPQGPAGATGATGPAGDTGPQGPTGAAATINGVNALNITAENGINATQSGSTLTLSVAGTFAGQVVANGSGQTPGTSLLRNSKLVSADTNPTVNGEINWTYK